MMNIKQLTMQLNSFKKYAVKHSCPLVEAIEDREWPLTYGEIATMLELAGERTENNISLCRPDSDADVYAFQIEQTEETNQ